MSKDNAQTKKLESNDNKEGVTARHKPWNYPDQYSNAQQYQYRPCCSPVDEIDAMDNEYEHVNATHSVLVQTEKSSFQMKQEKRFDFNKRSNVTNVNSKENSDIKRMNVFDNTSQKSVNEIQNVKLKKTGYNLDYQKITEKLVSKINTPEAFDEYTETDLDQPMDFTLCYSENVYDEKKPNVPYAPKNDFPCLEEAVEEEKNESVKSKGFLNKESWTKKEMFGNTSRSFKEIFNFFKDRDKKRIESTKVSLPEVSKLIKNNNDTSDQKTEKSSQLSQQSVEQIEKDTKSKNEAHCSQQTPLMFSRCSSLGSLTGFEQSSINDDRSSIVSDISRRTSGVISPSELPDSPAQIAQSGKAQSKPQIGCFGKKKNQMLQQDKLKIGQYSSGTSENSSQHSENCLKKSLIIKRSVFEDNITAFKDESTPTKIHSMAASSLSSLTIDDDDDYEIINKIINKEKENIPEESEIKDDGQEIVDKSNLIVPSTKPEKDEVLSGEPDENYNEEENDELTALTPYQEQLLDECIRRGIAKWTKQHIDKIKPFSWDLGLTCRATRAMLIRRFKMHLDKDFQNNFFCKTPYNLRNQTMSNNRVTREQSPEDETANENYDKYLNKDSNSPAANADEANNRFDENSYYISYEEHLLDECIRRGMAKITKRNINEIRPFSWDANQICLTTRAMMLHGRDESIHGSH